MKILVTGGAGFIGGNFIHYLLANHPEDSIVCLDKLTYAGHLSTLEDAFADPRFSFVRGDISDARAVEDIFSRGKFDIVVNFAAESHVDRSITNPRVFVQTNIAGTQVLLDACLAFGVKRFHQISTDEVYGDLPLENPELAFSEFSPLRASSPYSASKASADLLVGAYYRTYGLQTTISRSSNNYGKYQLPEKLVPLVITAAAEGRRVPVYGDGKNVRDWLYVDDHCRAIDLIMRGGTAGEVYNIGGGNQLSNLQTVKLILKEAGAPESLIEFVPDRKGHDRRYALDSQKLRSRLGWSPEVGFAEGLSRTVRWYKENKKWLESLNV